MCASKHRHWSSGLWLILLLPALFILYWPSLGAPYFFDDVRLPFLDPEKMQGFVAPPWWTKRFVSYWTFYWIDQLFPNTITAQRSFNLLLHWVNGVLLYGLIRRVGKNGISPRWLSVGAVAWFLLSPAAMHAVAYLQQRSILLVVCFALLSWLAWNTALTRPAWQRVGYLVLSTAAFVCAVFSKEQGITALVGHFALLLWHLPANKRRYALFGAIALSVVGAVVVFFFFRNVVKDYFLAPLDQLPTWWVEAFRNDPLGPEWALWLTAILMEAKAFFYQLGVWFVPLPSAMAIDLRPALPVTLNEPAGWLAVVGYLVWLVVCWRYLFVGKVPQLRFAAMGGALAGTHFLLEFTPYRVLDAIVLYRSYWWFSALPFVLVGLLGWLVPRLMHRPQRTLVAALCGAYLLAVGVVGMRYSETFRSAKTLWAHAAARIPDEAFAEPRYLAAWRPFYNLGLALIQAESFEEALEAFRKARLLNARPEAVAFHEAYLNRRLGNVAAALQAARFYTSVPWHPEFRVPLVNRVLVAMQVGLDAHDYPFVIEVARKAFGAQLERLDANVSASVRGALVYHYARAAVRLGDAVGAVAVIERHFGDDPPEELRLTYWDALQRAGQVEKALAHMATLPESVFRQSPAYLVSRALAYARLGDRARALKDAKAAAAFAPDNPTVRQLLSILER